MEKILTNKENARKYPCIVSYYTLDKENGRYVYRLKILIFLDYVYI